MGKDCRGSEKVYRGDEKVCPGIPMGCGKFLFMVLCVGVWTLFLGFSPSRCAGDSMGERACDFMGDRVLHAPCYVLQEERRNDTAIDRYVFAPCLHCGCFTTFYFIVACTAIPWLFLFGFGYGVRFFFAIQYVLAIYLPDLVHGFSIVLWV